MRGKLVQAGGSLSTLLPDGQEGYRKVFAGVGARGPQFVAWLVLLAPSLIVIYASAILGTGGGPGTSTEPLALYTFTALLHNLRFGYGSALAVLIFLGTFLLAIFFIRVLGADLIRGRTDA